MKILAGLHAPDEGHVAVAGRPVRFRSRRDAIRAGIGFIQQEFSLVESLTCAENLLLGHPDERLRLDRRRAARAIVELRERFGIAIKPAQRVRELSMGERQQLEIVIALAWGGRVLILDEPTSSTGESGRELLAAALSAVRAEGIGVVHISHKLPEVLELADRVTVMRHGQTVWEGPAAAAKPDELAQRMVGDASLLEARRQSLAPGRVLLRIDQAVVAGGVGEMPLRDIDLEVRSHEVVGVAGVAGNGQRELARLAAGLTEPDSGTVEAPAGGVGYVAEDRARDSLALALPLVDNAIVHAHRRPELRRWRLLVPAALRAFAGRLLARFHMDPGLLDRARAAWMLSGGNQQRLVLARELDASHGLLALHNPARGLDVAAIHDLFGQLDSFCAAGGGALLISPDLDELIGWADRIHVIYGGRLTESLPADRDAVAAVASRMAGIV